MGRVASGFIPIRSAGTARVESRPECIMAGFFYQLGRLAGPKIRKANWFFRSLTGTEAEAIAAEFQVGRDLAQAIEREMELDPDPCVGQVLQEVGTRLAGRVKSRHRKFAFRSLQAADANAFALPGGFVSVTRPLVELCERNPDEVAFILGHEMAHVIRRHAMDRMMTSTVLNAAMRAVPVGGLVRSQLGGILRQLLEQRYSQDQELDADQLGVRLARAAGFRADAAIQLLERLKRRSGEAPGIGEYFSSHPPFDLRITRVRQFLKR
jgi:predicted Zn-dependent protease